MKLILSLIVLSKFFINSFADDFTFFITTNSSLAVVLDDEYIRKLNLNISSTIKKTIDDIVRENLKYGGINVKYYSWTGIHLKRDFVAALTITDCEKTWKFFQSVSLNSILHLAITDSECPRLPVQKAITIPVLHTGLELPQILLDMRAQKVLNWDTTVLLYDPTYDDQITPIVHSLTSIAATDSMSTSSVYIFKISALNSKERLPSIQSSFGKLAHIKKKRFIILATNFDDILTEAKNFNFLDVYNEWLLFIADSAQEFKVYEISQNITEGSNLAFAVNKTSSDCKLSVFCAVQEVTLGLITAFSKVTFEESSLFGQISDEEWEAIRFTKEERLREILNYMRKFLKQHNECSICMKWSLEATLSWGLSVAEDTDKLSKKLLHVGSWIPMFGYSMKDVLFPNFEHKFRNISLNILTHNNPPWQILDRNDDKKRVKESGIVMEILKEISLRLNFTYKLKELYSKKAAEDERLQSHQLPGSLTNYIHPKLKSETTTQTFFLVAIATTVNKLEQLSFNYTIPISIQSYTFITKRPEEVSRLYLFTAPFNILTWVCLASMIVITAPSLYVINRLVPLEQMKTIGLLKMKNCYWYIYGALLQQGGMYLPKADSGRVILGIWWIGVIVLVTTYCGNLVAFLTFPNLQPGLDFLSELFMYKDIKTYGLRNGTYFQEYVVHTTRDDFKKVVREVSLYEDTIQEDLNSVEKGKRINIDWKINLQLTIQKNFEEHKICNFVLGKENFVDEQISLIVPGGSPYLNLINDEIYRLQQMGFIDKWHKEYLTTTNKCDIKGISRQITNHKVNLQDMQGCFLVLMLGLILSVGIISLEFGVNYIFVGRHKKSIISSTVLSISNAGD